MHDMMRLMRHLALGSLIALGGCGSPRSSEEAAVPAELSETTDALRAAIHDSVERAWAEMMAGARALDFARIRAGYVDRPTMAINGLIVEDVDSRFEEARRWLGSLRRLDASYDHVHLDVLSPAAAVATMNHHLRWIDTTGAAGEWHSAWTAVFRRVGNQWKIVYSHESVPPATPT